MILLLLIICGIETVLLFCAAAILYGAHADYEEWRRLALEGGKLLKRYDEWIKTFFPDEEGEVREKVRNHYKELQDWDSF